MKCQIEQKLAQQMVEAERQSRWPDASRLAAEIERHECGDECTEKDNAK